MLVISATVGGGSTFTSQKFLNHGWGVCVRPDKFLRSHTVIKPGALKSYRNRARKLVKMPEVEALGKLTNKQLCHLMYQQLNALNQNNIAMVCMSWGGLGYLKGLNTKPIYIIRHPLFAFNSYSGGGWRKTSKRTKGYKDHFNDWVDIWLNNRSHWDTHAKNAIAAYKQGKGYIVRYERFAKDWQKIPLALPPIHQQFRCRDSMIKVKRNLPSESIQYLMNKTGNIWEEVKAL